MPNPYKSLIYIGVLPIEHRGNTEFAVNHGESGYCLRLPILHTFSPSCAVQSERLIRLFRIDIGIRMILITRDNRRAEPLISEFYVIIYDI